MICSLLMSGDMYKKILFQGEALKIVSYIKIVSQSKSRTNKVKSGFTGAYSTCTPSTSSTNIPEKEALAGFADEIDDLDIEEMDINWQIAMIAIRMKKFYEKIGRRVRVDGKVPVGFDKKKLECFNCHNTG
ncbi:hypothetical protein Tco_1445342, partial [Tanacetum coccineum]